MISRSDVCVFIYEHLRGHSLRMRFCVKKCEMLGSGMTKKERSRDTFYTVVEHLT